MKTTANNSRKLSNGLSAMFFYLAAAFLFTSCQKDEMASPATTSSEESSLAKKSQTGAYTMLVIDHSAAQTKDASYRIELLSNGDAKFTGRKNTALKGDHRFQLSEKQTRSIQELFSQNFAGLEGLQFVNDLPQVTTSFKADRYSDAIQKIDNNNARLGTPLTGIRIKAEEIMQIKGMVKSIDQSAVIENTQHD